MFPHLFNIDTLSLLVLLLLLLLKEHKRRQPKTESLQTITLD